MWVSVAERAPAAPPGRATPAVGDAPLVQVAETLGKRSRLATEIIKGVILPQFVILPLAVLLVWLALARGIAPLNELQQRIRRRESSDLSPIDERQAPEEVAPLVRAINDLLTRLDQSMRSQKHFLADAAHQLKTPLAGLRTQAELAQRQIDAGQHDPQALKKTLQQIARSSQSAAHMVNQLLAMARAENQQQVAQRQPVNLARLATETVHDFVPRALEKRIDLGYEGPGDMALARHPQGPQVLGHALLLRELIRNLVDNALQYTPAGGTVTVRVIDDPFGQVVVLQVEDSGPGIPLGERELVFQPFYRSLGTEVDGSGLGLAIVREIAVQHAAEITVTDASGRSAAPGTLITVRLPASGPAGTAPAEPLNSGSAAGSSRSTSGSPTPDPA
jgi:two-component system, OmpR family, sensor histidine kinase TctE